MLNEDKQSEKKSYYVVGLLSVIMLGFSFALAYITNKSPEMWVLKWLLDFIAKFAMIFVTIFCGDLLWKSLGGRPAEIKIGRLFSAIKLLDKSKKTGLLDVYNGKEFFLNEIPVRLDKAKNEIFIMGNYLKSWVNIYPDFSNKIAELANKGVIIRFMIMDEKNVKINSFTNSKLPSCSMDDATKGIDNFCKAFENILNKLQPNAVKPSLVKVNDGLISANLCIIDNDIFFTPYFFTKSTGDSMAYLASGKETLIYMKYKEEFIDLWVNNGGTKF